MRILFIISLVLFSNILYADEYINAKKSDLNKIGYGILQPKSNKTHDKNKIVNAIITTKGLVGRAEKIRIYPGNIKLKARIDTGAETSSLHVTSTYLFFKNEEQWIHFTTTTIKGKTVHFEKKIQRIATIKRHYDEDQSRIVVLLGICLGNTYREEEVNLFDREGFIYPVLIGRNFLSNYYIVDSSQVFSVKPDCKNIPKNE